MPEQAPPDADQRRRIVDELDVTLFVEAGAGSGKTRSLVDRVHALVVHAGVPLREIAAITFTDKAAAELRDRVRHRLEAAAQDATAAGDTIAGERAAQALGELDGAAVSTLHAFAQRLLTEHPLAAGLPPRVEVADELSSQLAFEERWRAFLDELLDPERLEHEPDDELALLVVLDGRRPLEALRDVAMEFERNWDLVAEHVAGKPVPTVHQPDLAPILTALAAVAEVRFEGPDNDRLVELLDEVAAGIEQLEQAAGLRGRLRLLARLGALKPGRCGNKQHWRAQGWRGDLDELRADVDAALELCREAERRVTETCLRRLAARLAVVTLAAAEARRREGRLAFHDLLVLARELLRHDDEGAATRRVLHQRYTRLLLDEFQDTDPIQVDIARLLAADPELAAGGTDLAALDPLPGRLFFVGDPKQSIYRFRRADIATFLRTRAAVTDEPVQLSANFRTTRPVVDWVNAVFGHLIQEREGAQPAYQELVAVRDEPLAGPPVVTFGVAHDDKPLAAELRAREVADVVDIVEAAVAGWQVQDPTTGEVRAARHGDVAILLPTRTVLDTLEDGLDAAAIPYRTESSSLAYATREIRDLLLALRAIDDPSDELALVTTLRSPLFGCSDVELYRWRVERRGSWSLVGGEPAERLDDGDDTVHDALTELRALAAERHWLTPSVLLERLVRSRRVLELAGTGRRSRDVWRRIRYLLDQARAWQEAGGGSLRSYVTWAYRQASDSIRVTEAVLPETDHDAVRIMTVHAAKGLEFPIVVVAGLTTQPQKSRPGVDVLWTPVGPELRLDDTFVTRDYETTRALDEQLDEHERRRLLYVACTRARDHLAVSVHHRRPSSSSTTTTLAKLVADACAATAAGLAMAWPERGDQAVEHLAAPAARVAVPPPAAAPAFDLAAWQAEHTALLDRSGRPRTAAATSFAGHTDGDADGRGHDDPGLAKGGVDLDLPPWHKGRYGTAIGRAVHAVLQTVDLATGDGVEEAAAAQAAAEGVLGHERLVAALARSALRTACVHEAIAGEHWREVLVAAPIGPTLLEGYIDLLYRTDDGLVVVDYKTDQPRDAEDLDDRVERYRPQLAAYALAVEAVTGERVCRAVLVFCSAGPTTSAATEREVPRLAEAMAGVDAQLRAGTGGRPPPLPV